MAHHGQHDRDRHPRPKLGDPGRGGWQRQEHVRDTSFQAVRDPVVGCHAGVDLGRRGRPARHRCGIRTPASRAGAAASGPPPDRRRCDQRGAQGSPCIAGPSRGGRRPKPGPRAGPATGRGRRTERGANGPGGRRGRRSAASQSAAIVARQSRRRPACRGVRPGGGPARPREVDEIRIRRSPP